MIKILLVEDSPEKMQQIKDIILQNELITGENIVCKVSTNDARRELYDNIFDLLITDLLLPANFGDDPNAEESITLLNDIKNDNAMNKPLSIIGISAYEEKIEEYQEYFIDDDWSLMAYAESTHDWKNILTHKIDYIIRTKKFNEGINKYIYDIAIICALDDPEFKHIKRLSRNWETVKKKNSTIEFYETTFIREDKVLNIIAVSPNQMGMVSTSILATQMIELFRPKYIAMTGIAAGIPGEAELGDVLVVEYSWDYNSGKVKTDKDGNQTFEVDMRQESLDRDLCNSMNVLKNDKVFLNTIYDEYDGKKPKTYLEIKIGQLASGAAVIANSEITDNVTKQARKLKGIEMEAYGLFCAANYATNPKPKPLVIKSVCDLADENKSDDIQDYAAYTSAQVLYEFALRYL